MIIKILGPGCANCKRLMAQTQEAIKTLGGEWSTAELKKVEDYEQIASYGILSTPGLVLDEVVLMNGRVPNSKEIVELLKTAKSSGPC
ncbi:thioredoxin family protein [Bdellovibrionota bacterium FG-1]